MQLEFKAWLLIVGLSHLLCVFINKIQDLQYSYTGSIFSFLASQIFILKINSKT